MFRLRWVELRVKVQYRFNSIIQYMVLLRAVVKNWRRWFWHLDMTFTLRFENIFNKLLEIYSSISNTDTNSVMNVIFFIVHFLDLYAWIESLHAQLSCFPSQDWWMQTLIWVANSPWKVIWFSRILLILIWRVIWWVMQGPLNITSIVCFLDCSIQADQCKHWSEWWATHGRQGGLCYWLCHLYELCWTSPGLLHHQPCVYSLCGGKCCHHSGDAAKQCLSVVHTLWSGGAQRWVWIVITHPLEHSCV